MDKEHAIAIAKKTALAAGWPWLDPAKVNQEDGGRTYKVISNAEARGSNVTVFIDVASGEVVRKSIRQR